MTDRNNNKSIEKFQGSFSKEESGTSIIINATVNLIKNPETLGLYCYLACRPNNWTINAKQLMDHFNCGRDKIYKLFNNLIELNLLLKTEIRTKGKFTRNHYSLYLKPFKPCTEKPDTVLPDPENKETYKTKNNNKQRIKEKKYIKKEKSLMQQAMNEVIQSKIQTDKTDKTDKMNNDTYPDTYYMQNFNPPTELTTFNEYGGYNITTEQQQDFEMFWGLYPRKTNKRRAAAQWFHDGCHLIADKIIDKLKQQIKQDRSFLDGYVPNPHKYIVEQRFNDEIFTGTNNNYDHNDNSWAYRKDIFDDLD